MNTLPGLPLLDPRHVVALLQHLVDQADLGENLEQLLSVVSPATLEQLKRTPTVACYERPGFEGRGQQGVEPRSRLWATDW